MAQGTPGPQDFLYMCLQEEEDSAGPSRDYYTEFALREAYVKSLEERRQ